MRSLIEIFSFIISYPSSFLFKETVFVSQLSWIIDKKILLKNRFLNKTAYDEK